MAQNRDRVASSAMNKLTDTLWKRLAWLAVWIFIAWSFSANYFSQASTLEAIGHHVRSDYFYAALATNIFGIVLLNRTWAWDRPAFVVGLLAGFLWILVGDMLPTPWWAGAMAILVSVLTQLITDRRLRLSQVIGLVLLGLGTATYSYLYSGASHSGFLVLWLLILAASVFIYSRINRMRRGNTASRSNTSTPQSDAPFEADIAQLEAMNTLSPELSADVADIIKYARLIQGCMMSDPRDVESGRKFFQRYLPAVHEILSKSQQLSGELARHGGAQDIDAQSRELIQSLRSAFMQKHAQLLENDETELKTEISTLEKLLKTDGFL
ncbi:hypothetical protein GWD52_03465 [Enterobacteriaceae bacterium 4M9]|nr:hypothetical protein [Enterobacteriaceae bacterium 4M9]